jgi:hypothetical protein
MMDNLLMNGFPVTVICSECSEKEDEEKEIKEEIEDLYN